MHSVKLNLVFTVMKRFPAEIHFSKFVVALIGGIDEWFRKERATQIVRLKHKKIRTTGRYIETSPFGIHLNLTGR